MLWNKGLVLLVALSISSGPLLAQPKNADLHCDLLMQLWKNPSKDIKTTSGDVSEEKLTKGQYALQVFGIFVPPNVDSPVKVARRQAETFKDRVLTASGGAIRIATTFEHLMVNLEDKVVSGILAMEGAHGLGDEPEEVVWFAQRGLRLLGITWNNSNAFADGLDETDPPPRGGLTKKGRELLGLMEKHAVVADLSHAHRETFWDVVTTARGPVLASHSNAQAVHFNRRNLDDEQLLAIAEKKGVVGLCFHSSFLRRKGKASISDFKDQYEYIARIAGESVPAIGSDFDGNIAKPEGIEDASSMKSLRKALNAKGLGEDQLQALFLGNVLAFWKRADEPFERIPPLDWRPMRVSGVGKDDAAKALFDRLSTTSQEFCASKGKGEFPRFDFQVEGEGLAWLALRVSGSSVGVTGVKASVVITDSGAEKQCEVTQECPADGSRCLVALCPEKPVRTDDNTVSLTLKMEGGGKRACVRVQDVVPLRKVTSRKSKVEGRRSKLNMVTPGRSPEW